MRRSVLGGLFVFGFSALLLCGTAGDYGLTDDEPAYIRVEERLGAWFVRASSGTGAFEPSARVQGWVFGRKENRNLPVPALIALVGRAASPRSVSPLLSYRIGPCLLMAATLGVLFGVTSFRWGMEAGIVGTAALLFMPQAFAHGHLNATDTPASCFFLLTLLFWSASAGGVASTVLTGAFLGLGFGSKASLFVLPLVLSAWILLLRRWEAVPRLGVVVLTALGVWLLVSPMWWSAPLGGAADFLGKAFGRSGDIWSIDSFYLGQVFQGSLPWHNAIILPLVATPPLTLALAAWSLRRDRDPDVWLFALGALVLPLLRMLPKSPGHDGVRLLLPSLYCLCPLAALGFRRLGPVLRSSATVLTFVVVCALETGLAHPFEISYYSELIFGLRGANALGFETSYWFDALTPTALREIQERLPEGASVWTYPSYPGYPLLRRWGLWRADLNSAEDTAQYLVLYTRRASLETRPDLKTLYGEGAPLWSSRFEGVQLVGLYRLPSVSAKLP